jgi:LysR family transcriptional regulator, glycine cleavage system transcriptional activator
VRNIPSLNGLKAFEAAGRLGSFAAAAAELHVTQTAVSRLVRLLETRLGQALFDRHANGVRLNERGAALLPGVSAAFDDLARQCARVAQLDGANALTVAAAPSFAMRWLIPRLARFQAAQPGIEVRLVTAIGLVAGETALSEEWTCAVRLGSGAWPGLRAVKLFDADLFPVCAPSLAKQLRKPADLKNAVLLRVASGPHDWAIWLKQAGIKGITPKGPRFDYDAFALQAALDGVGVAIAHRPYVADDLAAGRLVAPFTQVAARGEGWYLVHRSGLERSGPLSQFRAWLLREAAAQRFDHGRRSR